MEKTVTLNEVMPKQYVIKHNGIVHLETNDLQLVESNWRPDTGGKWELYQGGKLVDSKGDA